MDRIETLRNLLRKISKCEGICSDGDECGLPCLVLVTGGELEVNGFVYRAVGSEHDDRLLAMNDKVFEFKELVERP